MKYNFDAIIDRRNTNSLKWKVAEMARISCE
jgi:bifunctional pyridoxal-dependent enzyme with beta-cystathionase and maltose regulon repressor activities